MRHLKDSGAAFMVKLGWGLVNKKNALWARVLRAKYDCGNDVIPNMVKKNENSRMWKGIVKNWNSVEQGLE